MGLGCSPWGHKESESTERLSRSHLPQVCMPAVIFSPLIVLFFFFLVFYVGDVCLGVSTTAKDPRS